MQRVKLDRIDRRILRDLQEDGRMTNVELAERAGISAPPCLRRVKALERAGFIRGFDADVYWDVLAQNINIFDPNNPLVNTVYFGITELLHRLSALQEKFLILGNHFINEPSLTFLRKVVKELTTTFKLIPIFFN